MAMTLIDKRRRLYAPLVIIRQTKTTSYLLANVIRLGISCIWDREIENPPKEIDIHIYIHMLITLVLSRL